MAQTGYVGEFRANEASFAPIEAAGELFRQIGSGHRFRRLSHGCGANSGRAGALK